MVDEVRYAAPVVFPTGVGVYRYPPTRFDLGNRFPHRRGGVPVFSAWHGVERIVFPTGVGGVPGKVAGEAALVMFSPQAWGCTAGLGEADALRVVFPTGVGVYRLRPRMSFRALAFSPQAWGCTA